MGTLRMSGLHKSARRALAALALTVAVVAGGACSDSGAPEEIPASAAQPTSATPIIPTSTTTTHARSRHIEAVFDGEHCRYSGPDVARGDTEVSFENRTESAAGLAFLALVDEAAGQAEIDLVGTRFSVQGAPPPEAVQLVGVLDAGPGDSATQIAPLTPGTYLIDCVTFTNAGPDEVWRVAVLEVE